MNTSVILLWMPGHRPATGLDYSPLAWYPVQLTVTCRCLGTDVRWLAGFCWLVEKDGFSMEKNRGGKNSFCRQNSFCHINCEVIWLMSANSIGAGQNEVNVLAPNIWHFIPAELPATFYFIFVLCAHFHFSFNIIVKMQNIFVIF